MSPIFIFTLLLLALVGTAFGSTAWYLIIQRYKIGQLSLYFFLVPVFGLGIGLISGERFNRVEWLGATVIVIAILVSLLPHRFIHRPILADRG